MEINSKPLKLADRKTQTEKRADNTIFFIFVLFRSKYNIFVLHSEIRDGHGSPRIAHLYPIKLPKNVAGNLTHASDEAMRTSILTVMSLSTNI